METKLKNAVLVGIQLPGVTAEEVESSLAELTRLVTTLGHKVVGRVLQKRTSGRSAIILGDGKLRELADWTGGTGEVAAIFKAKLHKAAQKREDEQEIEEELIEEEVELADEDAENVLVEKNTAQIVIVDQDLSPSQIRNLESATGVTVLDRTGVIIEIFSRHARTKAAKIQVEIARLTYVAPRLRETGGAEERQGGKGAGESALELDKRRIRDRIKELKMELASIGKEQDVRRSKRQQETTVALVGYTNAGKSSLMRAMTGSEVLVADKLFATLDTTIRPMYPESRPKILLSDTVGFIKKLPHDLVASFKSTLDEALNASLLLFVVDASDPSFRSQLEVTRTVLKEVGATEVPQLLVLNKRDQLVTGQAEKLMEEFPEAIMISTRNVEDLKRLREKILSFFEEEMTKENIFVPYQVQGVVGEIRASMRVISESYSGEGTTFTVMCTEQDLKRIQKLLPTL